MRTKAKGKRVTIVFFVQISLDIHTARTHDTKRHDFLAGLTTQTPNSQTTLQVGPAIVTFCNGKSYTLFATIVWQTLIGKFDPFLVMSVLVNKPNRFQCTVPTG